MYDAPFFLKSFFTRSAQMIPYILVQRHISKLSRYLSSAIRSVQVSAPQKADMHSSTSLYCFFVQRAGLSSDQKQRGVLLSRKYTFRRRFLPFCKHAWSWR